jgi:hypothetical protein
MDDVISNIYYNDTPTRRKEYEEFILKTIETKSIIKIYIESSELRRHFHKWASANNLFHVSYCDKKMDFETKPSYWCETCKRYIKEKDYEIQYCCSDGQCGEYLIICNRCYFINDDDDHMTIIADESGAYDDVPKKKHEEQIILLPYLTKLRCCQIFLKRKI